MNVFISWSGDTSKKYAEILYECLPLFLHIVTPFYSPQSISPGDEYFNEIISESAKTDLIIACLTPENIMSPWINFEVGLMAGKNKVIVPILLNIDVNSIRAFPLSHYNCIFNLCKENVYKIIKIIHDNSKKNYNINISDEVLNLTFEMVWPLFNSKIELIEKVTI